MAADYRAQDLRRIRGKSKTRRDQSVSTEGTTAPEERAAVVQV